MFSRIQDSSHTTLGNIKQARKHQEGVRIRRRGSKKRCQDNIITGMIESILKLKLFEFLFYSATKKKIHDIPNRNALTVHMV